MAAAVVVPNNPPTVANAIPDQSATAGTAFSYVFPANTFSDADTGDTLSYTATKTDATALPTWLAFAAGTRTFSGTPQAADAGTVSVKVTASDGNGGSVSDTFDITVAADPNAHCNALDTSELWCGTLTVGVSSVAYGYNAVLSFGSVAPLTFTHGGATITVNRLLYAGIRFQFGMSSALGAGDFSLEIGTGGAKRSFAMNNPGIEPDFFNHGLSWSANETVPVKLLLVNTPATGAPAITGTAQVGQTLTATVGDIADVDGLPDPFLTDANTSFQWIRVATDNSETDISGAMAGAYTLVADDQGTTIKVKVSFTGNNGFAETRTSAATAAVSAVAAAVVPADWSLKPTAWRPATSSGCCSSPPPSATPRPPISRTTTPSSRPAPRPATPTSRTTARASGWSAAPPPSTPATTPPPRIPPPTRACPSTGSTAPRPPTSTRISTTGPGTTRPTTRTSPAPTVPTPPSKSTTPSRAAPTTAPRRPVVVGFSRTR